MTDVQTGLRWLPVPFAAAGLVVLAACGGGDGAAPAADPATAPGTTASADAFADCMTEQGVPAPEGGTRITGPRRGEPGQQQDAPMTRRNPPPAPDGVDPEKWEAALETCGPVSGRRTVAPGDGA